MTDDKTVSATEGLDPDTSRVVEALAAADAIASIGHSHHRGRDTTYAPIAILALAVLVLSVFSWLLAAQVAQSRRTRDARLDKVLSQLHDLETQLGKTHDELAVSKAGEERNQRTELRLVREIAALSEYVREHGGDPNVVVQQNRSSSSSPRSTPTPSPSTTSSSHPSPSPSPSSSPSPRCTVHDPLTGRCIIVSLIRSS